MPKKKEPSIVIEQPPPMRKQVYEQLRKQILNHAIEPSSRLVEAQIAKELGISRTPVREALHLLEKDGLVEATPRVGYRVKKLAWDELDEIFEIRSANELLACRWAIKRIDTKGLRALEKNLAMAQAALEKGHPESFLKYDEEFHEILVGAGGSQYLLELCQQLRRLMLRYRIESIRNAESVRNALNGHLQIFEALTKKDEKGLESALVTHLQYAKDNIREYALEGSKEQKAGRA